MTIAAQAGIHVPASGFGSEAGMTMGKASPQGHHHGRGYLFDGGVVRP